MPARWNRNRLTAKLGIEYPLVQGALGGFASQRLTAAVSQFGGLGSFGAHGLAPQAIGEVIAEIRSLTPKPFAMNLWVSMEDEGARTSSEMAFRQSAAALAPWLQELGAANPTYKSYVPMRFEDQVRVLLDARVPVFSFIFGIPPREILAECRSKGIFTIGGATTPLEASLLEEAGVDAVVASGFEAGGHRGSFARSAETSLYGTVSLVPQVADAVDVPVIAAGGIADARGVLAAFVLGAEAVQMGTVFLSYEESGVSSTHRRTLRAGKAGQTALTKAFTGRLARGIRNDLMDKLNEEAILPYPLQRALVRNLATAAERADRADLLPMWAGQSASLLPPADLNEFLTTLVNDLDSIAGSVFEWRSSPERQTTPARSRYSNE